MPVKITIINVNDDLFFDFLLRSPYINKKYFTRTRTLDQRLSVKSYHFYPEEIGAAASFFLFFNVGAFLKK